VQLTRGPSDDRAPCFRRDGALGFLSNRSPREGKPEEGDDERSQVWLLPAEGGEARPLTDEPLGVSAFRFARHADRLLLIAEVLPGVPHAEQRERAKDLKKNGPSALRYTRMPVRIWDHWLGPTAPHLITCDGEGGGRRDLTPGADYEHREAEWDLSPDGRLAIITHRAPGEDRLDDIGLLLLDTSTGESWMLVKESRTTFGKPLFSPDSSRVASVRSERVPDAVGKPELWLHDLASGVGRSLTASWDRWPNPQGWTENGAALLVTADDEGAVPVFTLDAETGQVARLTNKESGGTHDGMSAVPGRDFAVGIRGRTLHAPEPFRVSLRPGSEPSLLAGLSGFPAEEGAALAEWESHTVSSPDGTPVQFLVVRPRGEGPHPVLLWIHGGPIGQWSEGWHWRWNPLV
ncbi:MAG TPA: hypothetical protein VFU47_05090, partial [Armatimonadota bacterium]|nr:hypothetical protein [Armatimonadota bacterium]